MKFFQHSRLWMIFGILLTLGTGITICENSSQSGEKKKVVGATAERILSEGIPVEISVSAEDLPKADGFLNLAKSDPMCSVKTKEPGALEWVPYQRTNRLENELNPNFEKRISITYKFEELQPLLFQIYDVDGEEDDSDEDKLMGYAETRLGQLVSRGEMTLELRNKRWLRGDGNIGSKIHLRATESARRNRKEVFFRLRAEDIEDQEWFGKTDPFLRIEDQTGREIHRTEAKKNNLNPQWKPFHLPAHRVCNNNYDESLTFSCWNSNSVGSDEFIGSFQTTLNYLQQGEMEFELINEKKRESDEDYRNSGRVHVKILTKTVHSLMEYFEQGLKIRSTVAINFSDSDGDLHHISSSEETLNQYEQAIHSIVSTIESYTTEFPVLGFGARLNSDEDASQAFYVKMDDNPICTGAKGILHAYRSCVPKVHLDKTAKFASIIRRFIDGVHAQENEYHILLILTHGTISDLEETKEALREASPLPVSVIIVGIGKGDFDELRALNQEGLQRHGVELKRDMVEFVPFNSFFSEGGDLHAAGAQLARKALAQIPEHIISFKIIA